MLIGGGAVVVYGAEPTPQGSAPGRLSAVLYRASELPDNVTVTVGTGGVGAVLNANGTSGGNSAFGDFATPGGISLLRIQNNIRLPLAKYLSHPGQPAAPVIVLLQARTRALPAMDLLPILPQALMTAPTERYPKRVAAAAAGL